jgi:hypothetical protein
MELRILTGPVPTRQGDGRQQADNGNHNHDFHECEARIVNWANAHK